MRTSYILKHKNYSKHFTFNIFTVTLTLIKFSLIIKALNFFFLKEFQKKTFFLSKMSVLNKSGTNIFIRTGF